MHIYVNGPNTRRCNFRAHPQPARELDGAIAPRVVGALFHLALTHTAHVGMSRESPRKADRSVSSALTHTSRNDKLHSEIKASDGISGALFMNLQMYNYSTVLR